MTFIPYANVPYHELTADQAKLRRLGMIREAERLIEARGAVQRPTNPVQINQIHSGESRGLMAEQRRVDDMAQRLTAQLAERDKGNGSGGGRW